MIDWDVIFYSEEFKKLSFIRRWLNNRMINKFLKGKGLKRRRVKKPKINYEIKKNKIS